MGSRLVIHGKNFLTLFFTIFLATCESILEHSINNLVYFEKISKEYKKWFLWLDRFTAVLSALSRYQTVEKKFCFLMKKKSLFALVLYISLDMSLWDADLEISQFIIDCITTCTTNKVITFTFLHRDPLRKYNSF